VTATTWLDEHAGDLVVTIADLGLSEEITRVLTLVPSAPLAPTMVPWSSPSDSWETAPTPWPKPATLAQAPRKAANEPAVTAFVTDVGLQRAAVEAVFPGALDRGSVTHRPDLYAQVMAELRALSEWDRTAPRPDDRRAKQSNDLAA